jgi:addiction module HigA family antidote
MIKSNKILQGAIMPKLTQTPGSVLKSLLDEYQLSPAKLAQAIGLSNSAIYQITIGKTRVTASVAVRLAKYFGLTPLYWLDLQNVTDLAEAAKDTELSTIVKAISKTKKPPKAAVSPQAPAKKASQRAVKTAAPRRQTKTKPQVTSNQDSLI